MTGDVVYNAEDMHVKAIIKPKAWETAVHNKASTTVIFPVAIFNMLVNIYEFPFPR